MIEQTIAACTDGAFTVEQWTERMFSQNDYFHEKLVGSGILDKVSDFLLNTPMINHGLPKATDSVAVYLAQDHSHLISFVKGCSQLMYTLGSFDTQLLLRLLGSAI